jgi:hypothetical protein
VRLDLRDFNAAVSQIHAEWRSGESANNAWAASNVGPFSLEIHHKADGSIGWVSVDARVGGGVQTWRSRNELGVSLDEVIDGMREYLRSVSDDLAAVLEDADRD